MPTVTVLLESDRLDHFSPSQLRVRKALGKMARSNGSPDSEPEVAARANLERRALNFEKHIKI